MGAKGLPIRTDVPAAELRRLARRERNRPAAARVQAVAGALEGLAGAEAARLAGMERQALRDAVVRYNAEGVAGLYSRPSPGRRARLTRGAAGSATPTSRLLKNSQPPRPLVSGVAGRPPPLAGPPPFSAAC